VNLTKTVRAKVYKPTSRKYAALLALHAEWNRALDLPRNYKILRKETKLSSYCCCDLAWLVKPGHRAAVLLGKKNLNLKRGDGFVPWFASLTTPKGRVNLPLSMSYRHARLLDDPELHLGVSRLVKKGHDFFIHIVIDKEIPDPQIPVNAPVLAIDLGEKIIATSVTLGSDGQLKAPPRFMGRRVRSIRRHYARLIRDLGQRKALRVIKRIGSAEHREVAAELHRISRELVNDAKRTGSVIAIGDLSGIVQRVPPRGRRVNHKRNRMPFGWLTYMIQYKAAWDNVPVMLVNEAHSSHECHVCGQDGLRPSRGRFVCPACGEGSADLNGALTIGKRALGYMSIAGAPRIAPERTASSDGRPSKADHHGSCQSSTDILVAKFPYLD